MGDSYSSLAADDLLEKQLIMSRFIDSYDALFQVFQSLQPDDSFTLSGLRSEVNQDEVGAPGKIYR